MRLAALLKLLGQHGVNLTLTEAGKLRPTADTPPPAEVIEGIREHRAPLVSRLARGQRPDGRYYFVDLERQSGVCASCSRWQPVFIGSLMGLCPLTTAVEIHAAHRCVVREGRGWLPKLSVPASRFHQETIGHDLSPEH